MILNFLFIFYLGHIVQADDELYLLRHLDTNELHCVYHSPQGKMAGLAWILPANPYNVSHRLQQISSVSTQIKGQIHYDISFWKTTTNHFDERVSLPPFLDDSWNNLIEYSTLPHESRRIMFSRSGYDGLDVSVLAKSDAQLSFITEDDELITIKFDPDDALGSLTLEFCYGVLSANDGSCAAISKIKTSREDGILRQGKEWVHFTIEIETIKTKMIKSIKITDSKHSDVILNIRNISLQSDPFELPFVPYLKSAGFWKIQQSLVLLHDGSGGRTEMTLNLISTSPSRSCVNIRYIFNGEFGTATVEVESTSKIYRFQPTYGTWKHLTIRFNSGGESQQKLIFMLPQMKVKLHGYVFAIQQLFNCTEGNVWSFIQLKAEEHKPIDSNIACQTISYEDKEHFVSLKSTISDVYSECKNSVSSIGKFCNLPCPHFSGKSTCEQMIVCDRDLCRCLPGHHFIDNACVPGPPDRAISTRETHVTEFSPERDNVQKEERVASLVASLIASREGGGIQCVRAQQAQTNKANPISQQRPQLLGWATFENQTNALAAGLPLIRTERIRGICADPQAAFALGSVAAGRGGRGKRRSGGVRARHAAAGSSLPPRHGWLLELFERYPAMAHRWFGVGGCERGTIDCHSPPSEQQWRPPKNLSSRFLLPAVAEITRTAHLERGSKMPVRRGHVAPRTTIIETIIRKFDTHNRSFLVANNQPGQCHIIYCSDGFSRLSGFSRAEVMQRPAVCDFLHGALTSQHAVSHVKDALAAGVEKHFEILYYKKDGTKFLCSEVIAPVKSEVDDICLYILNFEDLTAATPPMDDRPGGSASAQPMPIGGAGPLQPVNRLGRLGRARQSFRQSFKMGPLRRGRAFLENAISAPQTRPIREEISLDERSEVLEVSFPEKPPLSALHHRASVPSRTPATALPALTAPPIGAPIRVRDGDSSPESSPSQKPPAPPPHGGDLIPYSHPPLRPATSLDAISKQKLAEAAAAASQNVPSRSATMSALTCSYPEPTLEDTRIRPHTLDNFSEAAARNHVSKSFPNASSESDLARYHAAIWADQRRDRKSPSLSNVASDSLRHKFSIQDNGSAKFFQGALHTPNMATAPHANPDFARAGGAAAGRVMLSPTEPLGPAASVGAAPQALTMTPVGAAVSEHLMDSKDIRVLNDIIDDLNRFDADGDSLGAADSHSIKLPEEQLSGNRNDCDHERCKAPPQKARGPPAPAPLVPPSVVEEADDDADDEQDMVRVLLHLKEWQTHVRSASVCSDDMVEALPAIVKSATSEKVDTVGQQAS
ncbi:Hypothetical predicted protein [Cloeon dipterum]|uniref:PAS domain-containing protein n=1 Tax=Cloeon dipterum TaxID=197152 RepID=A0A8S1CMI3_9INSE|nr:Hypothetical predicted protein [Cloeon dipterum]